MSEKIKIVLALDGEQEFSQGMTDYSGRSAHALKRVQRMVIAV